MRLPLLSLLVGALGIGGLTPDGAIASPLIELQLYALDAWRVDISTDRFSRQVRCRLYARDRNAFYVANAVGLRMGRRTSVTDSWIRTDGGPAVRWRDYLPELARLRIDIDGRDVANPTDGIVWLPLTAISGKVLIEVQPGRGKRVRHFSLEGFADVLEGARRSGCMPEARFVQ